MNFFKVFLHYFFAIGLGYLPRFILRGFGICLGIFWFDIVRFRRRLVLENLERAYPNSTMSWRIKTGRRSLIKLAINFFEFFMITRIDSEWLEKNVVIEGWEHLTKAKEQGRGVFLLSLHMGAYDIGASIMPMKGAETYLISKFFKNKILNDLWFGLRGSKGMKFIEPHGSQTAFEILKALKKNAGVIFVLDQFMGRPYGIPTTFFGIPTATAYGLALFKLKTQAPIIPVYSVTDKHGRLHLIFEPEVMIDSDLGSSKEESMTRMTQKMNTILESIITKYPDEWLWIHRRWKEYE